MDFIQQVNSTKKVEITTKFDVGDIVKMIWYSDDHDTLFCKIDFIYISEKGVVEYKLAWLSVRYSECQLHNI